MRIHALSDLHVDYAVNAQWSDRLSRYDYTDDVLIVAGDLSHSLPLIARTLRSLTAKFAAVLFVPGNHDVWVIREEPSHTSFAKFDAVCHVAFESGALTAPYVTSDVAIVPLSAWYDYSFGAITAAVREEWMDFHACRWPAGIEAYDVALALDRRNDANVRVERQTVISFSHFLPRIDIMPEYIPQHHRRLYPVLGTVRLERRIRQLGSTIHVYGHSHLNRTVAIDGVTYVNNAFGYPWETTIAAKELRCIHGS
jgi:predicted phosphodiesterase